ncbi:MAG: hypothetical protein LC749_11855 [Actinobacteria bacterium]|nr:hypothetical protein [Actinomycetota bacterium]
MPMGEVASLAKPRRRGSEHGAIFPEFAVVLPLLLAPILGIFTGARLQRQDRPDGGGAAGPLPRRL